MKNDIRIIGIFLIKNEDIYIQRVLKNIIDFCDEIIILDNMSTDNTYKILSSISEEYNRIRLYRIENALDSHKFVEEYANTNTWVFRVDGDEIFDRKGLQKLKLEILSGKYQDKWMIRGHFLHCAKIDLDKKIAKGYLAPPAKEAIKLYNFSVLDSWKSGGGAELFHCGNIVFRDGHNKETLLMYKESSWEDSYLRCLHMRFVPRSTLEMSKSFFGKFFNKIFWRPRLNLFEISTRKPYIYRKYKRGKMVTKDVSEFFV